MNNHGKTERMDAKMSEAKTQKDPRQEYAQAFDDEAMIDSGEVAPEDVLAAAEETQEQEAAPEDARPADAMPPIAADEELPAPADTPMGTAAEQEQAAPALDIDKETQRLKSWEGRLKAREAQLKAKEVGGGDDAAGDVLEQAVELAADKAQAGMPLDEVMQSLSDDFGDDFAKALNTLIEAKISALLKDSVEGRFARVTDDVNAIIDAIKNDKQRDHFEFIAERHPDFVQVGQSDAFGQWVDGRGEEAKSIVNAGSARQVCALLDEFKKGQAKGEPESTHEHDAQTPDPGAGAVAVSGRASGLRLPVKPGNGEDFLTAWEEA